MVFSLLYLKVEIHNIVCVHLLKFIALLAKLNHRIMAISLLQGLKLLKNWVVLESETFNFSRTRRYRLRLAHRNHCLLLFKLFEIFDLLFHPLFIDFAIIILLMLWHPCIEILIKAFNSLGHATQLPVKICLLIRLDFKLLHIKLVPINILLF